MDIEEKKKLASAWFRELRDSFCEEFEAIDATEEKIIFAAVH